MIEFFKRHSGVILFIAVLVLAGTLHGFNMFHFPYYESDEGTYISQAWTFAEQGELAPYTYWYDHPPLGWIAMAGFVKVFLAGDFFAFGTSIDTLRVLMLLIHIASTALIFLMVRKATNSNFSAFFAGFLFSISPLEIYFHRRVLLDNIMTFWLLASSASLFMHKLKLRHYILSGLFFAFAVLTKITAVMFGIPILLYALLRGGRMPLAFRAAVWLMVSILTTSIFLLYAAINGELLPAPNGEHVSFIGTLLFQAGRGAGSTLHFWEAGSSMSVALGDWAIKDAFAVLAGVYFMIFSIVMSIFVWRERRHKELAFFVLSYIFYIVFLVRGGIVINFYIIPILPFAVMALATTIDELIKNMYRHQWARNVVVMVLTLLLGTYYAVYAPTRQFYVDETVQQKKAIHWIKENLPNDTAIIADNYALVDLWSPKNINTKTFPNADWFYKINRDPEIRDDKYHGDWQSFDYISLTHEMLSQIKTDQHPIVKKAFLNSTPVAKWLTHNNMTVVDENRFLTTNGDWSMIYRVQDKHHARLLASWNTYHKSFINNQANGFGKVTDPQTDSTSSKGQAYAMLRAAWVNDKHAFLGAWLWTRDHLQYRQGDKLLSSKWKDDKIVEASNATDADTDIALALLFGYKLWNDESYLFEAKQIIGDIWEQTVTEVNGTLYLLPMHRSVAARYTPKHGDIYIFNPSYLSPAHYKIFAQVDPDKSHDWERLAKDSYKILNRIGTLPGSITYLPQDWLAVGVNTGTLYSASEYLAHDTHKSSKESYKTLWRVALDEQWFDSPQASKYLAKVNKYLTARYTHYGNIPTALRQNGVSLGGDSVATNAVYAMTMSYSNEELANKFLEKFVNSKYDTDKNQWNNGSNYNDANWAWFGYGAYHKSLLNLWTLNIYLQ